MKWWHRYVFALIRTFTCVCFFFNSLEPSINYYTLRMGEGRGLVGVNVNVSLVNQRISNTGVNIVTHSPCLLPLEDNHIPDRDET